MAKVIDKTYPWGYFDGSASGDPKICGAGGVLFIYDDHFILSKLVWALELIIILNLLG